MVGQKCFSNSKPGSFPGLVNKDSIKKYVTALNSHDGSTSLRWGHTNITVSCLNTFNAAYQDVKQTAKHTASIKQRIEDSLRQLEALAKVETNIFHTYTKMSETPSRKDALTDVVKYITGVDMTLSKEDLEKNYTTYNLNRVDELLASITQEMKQKGDTLWGLFSGVTHYTTHKMPVPQRDNGRLESKYVGKGFGIDNDVFYTFDEFIKNPF
jgi:hypothetical protein